MNFPDKINRATLRVVASVGFLGLIFWKLDLEKVLRVFSEAETIYLILAFSVSTTSFLVRVFGMRYLLSSLASVGIVSLLKANFSTAYMRNIAPSQVAGLMARPWLLNRFTRGKLSLEEGATFTVFTSIVDTSRIVLPNWPRMPQGLPWG